MDSREASVSFPGITATAETYLTYCHTKSMTHTHTHAYTYIQIYIHTNRGKSMTQYLDNSTPLDLDKMDLAIAALNSYKQDEYLPKPILTDTQMLALQLQLPLTPMSVLHKLFRTYTFKF